ncbi:hypothetical protein [Aureibacillus halotolerans]|uniref:Uncharacterized protein n=1 Tax=Aureibacillus halotolerans TaxID=1508390 RepID=A0A4V3D597_9BACI|nr:hypothetical protein [Aureibacillus halotolerans]TDQ39247.1 hypothetical protein EV213_108199 [Aureibacillus halotolerans]
MAKAEFVNMYIILVKAGLRSLEPGTGVKMVHSSVIDEVRAALEAEQTNAE